MAQINLPADLPENLVKGQIIPANGSEQGLPEQYGYNYLLKQVNSAQKALNNLDVSQIAYGKSELQTIGDALDHVIEVAGSLNEKVIISDTEPKNQPVGGMWLDTSGGLSDIGETGVMIANMVISDIEPEDKSALWGDINN